MLKKPYERPNGHGFSTEKEKKSEALNREDFASLG